MKRYYACVAWLLLICAFSVLFAACGSGKNADRNTDEQNHTQGETDTHKEHIWDDGKIKDPATAEKEGVKVYTCTECGETKQETFPYVTTVTKQQWIDFWNTESMTLVVTERGSGDVLEYAWDGTSFRLRQNDRLMLQYIKIDGIWHYYVAENGELVIKPMDYAWERENATSFIFPNASQDRVGGLYDQLTYSEHENAYTLITHEFDDSIEWYRFYCENGRIVKMEVNNVEKSDIVEMVFDRIGQTIIDPPALPGS